MKKRLLLFLLLVSILASCVEKSTAEFDGENAYVYAQSQVEFGPRTPGSEAHQKTIELIKEELTSFGWIVDIQSEEVNGYLIQNIIGKYPTTTAEPWIIIGAHYDSRFYANKDTNISNQIRPVLGANDGASGVSVLLELARVLPPDLIKNIWFVFFDVEDQGNIDGWDWVMGSRSFVQTLEAKPDAVVILDMIGDKDLKVYYERNSDVNLQKEIWDIAADLGYVEYFIPEFRHSVLDDHIPFIENGITAIDIIDFDYPYWHTSQDTIDKLSPERLEIIGKTIYHWLLVP
ncbi:MAG: peptidase [Chloroflexi bacterium HGW-Chloroflexi-3]|nr:MAG: peptidase [Chloroflexi bacterium HGW-Chloroflexi-3]